MAKHAGGRPRKLSKQQIDEIIDLFANYIEDTNLPIIAEFAYLHLYEYGLTRQSLYDYEEFSTLLKRCIDKKEVMLERMGLAGEYNPTLAIFSLKQLGWSDKKEIAHTIDVSDTEKKLKGIYGKFTGEDS